MNTISTDNTDNLPSISTSGTFLDLGVTQERLDPRKYTVTTDSSTETTNVKLPSGSHGELVVAADGTQLIYNANTGYLEPLVEQPQSNPVGDPLPEKERPQDSPENAKKKLDAFNKKLGPVEKFKKKLTARQRRKKLINKMPRTNKELNLARNRNIESFYNQQMEIQKQQMEMSKKHMEDIINLSGFGTSFK